MMQAHVQIILSGALSFGVPLAIAVHELIVLRRGPDGSAGGWHDPLPPKPTPPLLPGSEPASKPLPPCLIPQLGPRTVPPAAPERTRVLEPA